MSRSGGSRQVRPARSGRRASAGGHCAAGGQLLAEGHLAAGVQHSVLFAPNRTRCRRA